MSLSKEQLERAATAIPTGCLGCNHDAIHAYLVAHDVDPSRFKEMPEARHAWADIIRCSCCGRDWLRLP